MYLLDTNICIYFMKNSYPHLTDKILSCNPSDLLISSITVYELSYGAEKSNWGEKSRLNLALFLAPFTILPGSRRRCSGWSSLRRCAHRRYRTAWSAPGGARNTPGRPGRRWRVFRRKTPIYSPAFWTASTGVLRSRIFRIVFPYHLASWTNNSIPNSFFNMVISPTLIFLQNVKNMV